MDWTLERQQSSTSISKQWPRAVTCFQSGSRKKNGSWKKRGIVSHGVEYEGEGPAAEELGLEELGSRPGSRNIKGPGDGREEVTLGPTRPLLRANALLLLRRSWGLKLNTRKD